MFWTSPGDFDSVPRKVGSESDSGAAKPTMAGELDRPVLAETAAEFERRVFSKVAWRLMPILTISYILNYLDRNNVGFAALTMNKDIGLTATQFGVGAGVLFLSYCTLEIPSNLALYRFGARNWISRIMVTWGLISAATIFVTGPNSWYVLRFALGAAEAGFFPGVAFYIGTWFPAQYRSRMLAWFLLAVPLSSVVSGPVSGLLLGMNGIGGLAGWKWLFIVEGLPVTLLGIVLLWVLADRPENARWLTEEERQLIHNSLAMERREKEVRHFLPALKDVRVLMLAGVQFCFLVGAYGVGIWLPQIIKAGNMSDRNVGFVFSGCYVLASAGMIAWSAVVDRTGRRIKNLTLLLGFSGWNFPGYCLR